MRNLSKSGIIGVAIVSVCIVVELLVSPLPVAVSRLLPVDKLPQRLSNWSAVGDVKPDPSLKEALPTSKIVERTYMDQAGNQVDVTAITATDYSDLHDPTVCFPMQGWTLSKTTTAPIGSPRISTFAAQQGSNSLRIWYWMDGTKVPKSSTPLLQKISDFRSAHLARREGQCLFIRVMGSAKLSTNAGLYALLQDIQARSKQWLALDQ